MSDPVSNHDIEDVLSSIRRLVAQGDPRRNQTPANTPTQLHPTPPSDAVKSKASDEAEPVERLVLTPAFRVSETHIEDGAEDASEVSVAPFDAAVEHPESDSIPTKDSRPIPEPGPSPSERASLEATIAELEAAVNRRADDWEPDGSEVSPTDSFTSVFLNKLDAIKLAPRDMDVEIDETDDAAADDVVNEAVANHIAEAVSEEITDAFPHLGAADEMPDLDEASSAEPDVDEIEEAPALAESGGVDQVVSHTEAPLEAEAEQPADEIAAVDADDVEDPIVVATPTFRHAAYQPVYDPVAEATADAAEAAPDAGDIYGDELAPDPQEAVAGGAVATPAGSQLVDPDLMRQMVGQMIREELQGEMGERITRNVRKLVRREINRVISAQEFD